MLEILYMNAKMDVCYLVSCKFWKAAVSVGLRHFKIINSCEITPKTGAGACVHNEIKCDIEQKSYSVVN